MLNLQISPGRVRPYTKPKSSKISTRQKFVFPQALDGLERWKAVSWCLLSSCYKTQPQFMGCPHPKAGGAHGVCSSSPQIWVPGLQEGLSNCCSRSGRAEQKHRNTSRQEHQNPTASIHCCHLMARKAKLVTSSLCYVVLSKPRDALNTNVETS